MREVRDNYARSQHVDDQAREFYYHRMVIAIFLLTIAVAPIVHGLGIYR